MLHHAKNWPAVAKALPVEPREVIKLPRAYLANIIYTCVGAPFRNWVDKAIQARNDKIVEEQNLAINMDPDVFAAFQASKHVSVQNGGSQFLFKASSVRRRSK